MSTHATNIAYKEIVNQLVMARRKTLNVNQAIHLSSAQLTNTLQQRLDDLQISNNSPQYVA